MKLLTDRELDYIIHELELPSNSRNYLDFTKQGKWTARLLLLTAMFHENKELSTTDLVYHAFSEEQFSTIENLSILKPSVRGNLKIESRKIPVVKDRSQIRKLGVRNTHERLIQDGYLRRTGKNNRRIGISEEGRQVALVVFGLVLKANGVQYQEIIDFARTHKLPQNRRNVFQKLKLIDAAGRQSEYTKALGKMFQKSTFLRNKNEEKYLQTNIVSHIRDSLLQRVLQSDSPMIVTKHALNADTIPSDWVYRLGSMYDDGEFDVLHWFHQIEKRDENFKDYDSEPDLRTLGISIIAEPGHGKTKWIEQSAIEIWNSQWAESNRAETPIQLKRKSSILPILVNLRKVDVSPDIDNKSVVHYDRNQPLWPLVESHIDPSLRKVMAHLLKATLALPDAVKDIEPIIRDLEYGKKFILFLDGWDELPSDARNYVSEYVEFFLENGVPTIVSSRELDSSLARITSGHLSLESLNDDAIIAYAEANGMELTRNRIRNIRKWIGEITPLDLRVLTVFPELDKLPKKRVALYRNWIVFQTIREGCTDSLPPRFTSDTQVKEFLVGMNVQIKESNLSFSDLLYGIPNSISSDSEEDYSIMHYVSKVAYLEMIERNQTLDYRIAVDKNPLLKGFIEENWTNDLRSYPQIRKKHLIPYLASEFILREYLSSRYWSVKGNPFTLSFLEEVLEYDGRRVAGHEKMTSNQVKLLILIEAESQDNDPTPIKNLLQFPQPPYYSSLYYSLIEYWKNAVRAENKRAQDTILQSFDYLILTNCYLSAEIPQDADVFVSDIYLIERELGEVDPLPVIQGTHSDEYSIHIENRTGWSLGYVSQEQLNILYSELLMFRHWLIPWIIRVASLDVREKVIDQIERIPNKQFRFSILNYELVEDPARSVTSWVEVLCKIIRKTLSDDLISLLSDTLIESDLKISDEMLETILGILWHDKLDEDHKYSLIVSTASNSFNRRQKEHIRQVLLDAPKLKQKYYFALAAIHDIDNMELESFFTELEQTADYKWMALLLRRIVKGKQTELVRERFSILPFRCINIIETQLLKPQTFIRIERGRISTHDAHYLDDESVAKMQLLCKDWWNHYLSSIEDAINILDEILEPFDFDNLGYMHVPYGYHETFERIVAWIQLQDQENQSRFFISCLEKKLDITIMTERNILKPLIKGLSDDKSINLKLVELYKNYPYFLLDFWGKDTWIKYIKLFPREQLVSDERFFAYFVEAGGLSSIDDAIDAIEINTEIMGYRDTTDSLIDWLSKRTLQEQVTFVERVLDFDISLVYLSKILRKLKPIKKYPKIHSKLIKIANTGKILPYPSSIREEPEGHHLPRQEIAYIYLSPQEKMKIIEPKMDRLLASDWSEDEYVNNIIAEYLHISEKKDLDKIAKFLDRFPTYANAVLLDEGEKSQALFNSIKNPVTKILVDIFVPNYNDFVTEVDIKKAKDYLIALINEDSGEPYWGAVLAFSLYKQRENLQDFVISLMDRLPIDWNSFPKAIGWLETILTKGKEKHAEFAAAKMDAMDLEFLIELYQSMLFGKDETFYSKLLSVLYHLKNKTSVIVTIAAAAHLGEKSATDVSELWETSQFKSLDSKNRIDLKSGRWFTAYLDNSVKGDWSIVTF